MAMEGMASEACDRERMYLDVLGSRDLMSKSPFLPVKPNVKRRKHTSPTTTSVSRRRQLSCVSLCPSAPPLLAHSRQPHAPHTPHSTLKAAHDFDFSCPTTHTPLALTNTHIKSLSPCPNLSIKKEVPYHLTTDDTHTAHHRTNSALSPKATFQTNTKKDALLR